MSRGPQTQDLRWSLHPSGKTSGPPPHTVSRILQQVMWTSSVREPQSHDSASNLTHTHGVGDQTHVLPPLFRSPDHSHVPTEPLLHDAQAAFTFPRPRDTAVYGMNLTPPLHAAWTSLGSNPTLTHASAQTDFCDLTSLYSRPRGIIGRDRTTSLARVLDPERPGKLA